MNKLDFWKELFTELGKDTARKRAMLLNKELKELDYVIVHLEPSIKKNGFAYYLGETKYRKDLKELQAQKEWITVNFEQLKTL